MSNSDVTTKYQEAAKIANLTMQGVVQMCVPGAKINDLCKFGDTVIVQVRNMKKCAMMVTCGAQSVGWSSRAPVCNKHFDDPSRALGAMW